MVKCIMGSLAGAIIAFAWTAVSWMVLPWHNWDMKSFSNEGQVVTQAIQSEATESGIYVLPNISKEMQGDEAKHEEWMEKAKKGPFVYMNLQSQGTHWDMKMSLIIQFITLFIIAAIATCLLGKSTFNNVLSKAFFISITVTLGSFLCNVSAWNWWSFPITTTWVNTVDVAIGWFLAGLAIAAIGKNKPIIA